MDYSRYIGESAYNSSIDEFLKLDEDEFIKEMKEGFNNVYYEKPNKRLVESWRSCFNYLICELRDVVDFYPTYGKCHIIFEYCIAGEINKEGCIVNEIPPVRSDVIILTSRYVYVFEFKDYGKRSEEELGFFINQARKYKKRLRNYHDESRDMFIKTILVCLNDFELEEHVGDVNCWSFDVLSKHLIELFKMGEGYHRDPYAWMDSTYSEHTPKKYQKKKKELWRK